MGQSKAQGEAFLVQSARSSGEELSFWSMVLLSIFRLFQGASAFLWIDVPSMKFFFSQAFSGIVHPHRTARTYLYTDGVNDFTDIWYISWRTCNSDSDDELQYVSCILCNIEETYVTRWSFSIALRSWSRYGSFQTTASIAGGWKVVGKIPLRSHTFITSNALPNRVDFAQFRDSFVDWWCSQPCNII